MVEVWSARKWISRIMISWGICAIAMFMAAIPASQVVSAPLAAMLLKVRWLGFGGWCCLLMMEGFRPSFSG